MIKRLPTHPPALSAEKAEKALRKRILLWNALAVSLLSALITILLAAAYGPVISIMIPELPLWAELGIFALWLAGTLLAAVDASLFERRRGLGLSVSLSALGIMLLVAISFYTEMLSERISSNLHLFMMQEHALFFAYGIPGLAIIGLIAIVLWNRQPSVNVLPSENSWVVGYDKTVKELS